MISLNPSKKFRRGLLGDFDTPQASQFLQLKENAGYESTGAVEEAANLKKWLELGRGHADYDDEPLIPKRLPPEGRSVLNPTEEVRPIATPPPVEHVKVTAPAVEHVKEAEVTASAPQPTILGPRGFYARFEAGGTKKRNNTYIGVVSKKSKKSKKSRKSKKSKKSKKSRKSKKSKKSITRKIVRKKH